MNKSYNRSASGYQKDKSIAKKHKKSHRVINNKSLFSMSKRLNPVRKKFKVFSMRSGLDMPFFFINMAILVIGLIMLFSASYPNAYYYKHGDSYYFIRSQLIWAVIGVVAMIAISYFDYHHLHKFAVPVLGLSFILLVVVLTQPECLS